MLLINATLSNQNAAVLKALPKSNCMPQMDQGAEQPTSTLDTEHPWNKQNHHVHHPGCSSRLHSNGPVAESQDIAKPQPIRLCDEDILFGPQLHQGCWQSGAMQHVSINARNARTLPLAWSLAKVLMRSYVKYMFSSADTAAGTTVMALEDNIR